MEKNKKGIKKHEIKITDKNGNRQCFLSANVSTLETHQRINMWYLKRLRAVGVMEAVGEEEDRESGEEAALIAIREDDEDPSEADMSLLISSLLRRVTV